MINSRQASWTIEIYMRNACQSTLPRKGNALRDQRSKSILLTTHCLEQQSFQWRTVYAQLQHCKTNFAFIKPFESTLKENKGKCFCKYLKRKIRRSNYISRSDTTRKVLCGNWICGNRFKFTEAYLQHRLVQTLLQLTQWLRCFSYLFNDLFSVAKETNWMIDIMSGWRSIPVMLFRRKLLHQTLLYLQTDKHCTKSDSRWKLMRKPL